MLAEKVLTAARQRGWRLATAESCTGGLISAALTDIPGSSDVFERGFVTYTNEAKEDLLAVSSKTLSAHGAVSDPVAAEMAAGALKASRADLAISVTGIAGPGGSEFKPEGLVCFGLATRDVTRTERVEFGALGRLKVRAASVQHALEMILSEISRTGS